mmetsp:Transcript_31403/g.51977  ORF Transcript_31403/g.51977 Transcript_31403/m.51977 type:complete len:223 (-) Transcript_31403:144-812(-)
MNAARYYMACRAEKIFKRWPTDLTPTSLRASSSASLPSPRASEIRTGISSSSFSNASRYRSKLRVARKSWMDVALLSVGMDNALLTFSRSTIGVGATAAGAADVGSVAGGVTSGATAGGKAFVIPAAIANGSDISSSRPSAWFSCSCFVSSIVAARVDAVRAPNGEGFGGFSLLCCCLGFGSSSCMSRNMMWSRSRHPHRSQYAPLASFQPHNPGPPGLWNL